MADSTIWDLDAATSLNALDRMELHQVPGTGRSVHATIGQLGGLVSSSLPDSDTTLTVGTLYHGSVDGLTTSRTYTLPTTAALFERVGVMATVGSATKHVIIQAGTGQTLNGIAANTEWSRLFITGEVVVCRYMGSNVWDVEVDGRIPCVASIAKNDVQTLTDQDTWYEIVMNEIVANVGGMVTLPTITVRRPGQYMCVGGGTLQNVGGSQQAQSRLTQAGTNVLQGVSGNVPAGGSPTQHTSTTAMPFASAAAEAWALQMRCYRDAGTTTATGTSNRPRLALTEIL